MLMCVCEEVGMAAFLFSTSALEKGGRGFCIFIMIFKQNNSEQQAICGQLTSYFVKVP